MWCDDVSGYRFDCSGIVVIVVIGLYIDAASPTKVFIVVIAHLHLLRGVKCSFDCRHKKILPESCVREIVIM